MSGFDIIPSTALVQPKPFTINVPEQDLHDFKLLLRLSKIAPPTYENARAEFGITRDWLVTARDAYLSEGFDWRGHERRINSFPNFKTRVVVADGAGADGIDMHFAALFSKREDAVPIMFMHGWPGSFLEFLPMMALLREKYTSDTLPYHVIVPSLPGYTLSGGPPLDKDFGLEDVGRVLNQLMIDLGFGSTGYVAQGGDVGSFVARLLGSSKECRAIHVNSMFCSSKNPQGPIDELMPDELAHLERGEKFYSTGSAYGQMQGSRPGTIGLTLSSSPLAMLAWIGEKLVDCVDEREPIDLDTILVMVALYWFTDCYPRCIYPYRSLIALDMRETIEKPFGYSVFPAEISILPEAWSKSRYPNMIRYRHDKGGHFAALEQPSLFLRDIEDFVGCIHHLFI